MQFDVALSFAGEDRAYVEKVAFWLQKMGYRIFYDKYETVSLWGENLYEYLIDIYHKKSHYAVIFGSKHYKNKIWATHELRAAQARAIRSIKGYILPAHFDETTIPGVLSTIGYINLKEYTPKEFALLIKKKVGHVPRRLFCPEDPDLLYKKLKATNASKRKSALIGLIHFIKTLGLMTMEERRLLEIAVLNTCPCGPPNNNVHLEIEYFGRIVKLTPDEIISRFSRLDCLGIQSEVKYLKEKSDKRCKSSRFLYLKYCPLADNCPDNITFIMIKVFEALHEILCSKCRVIALKHLDFSFLSSLAGHPDKRDTFKHRSANKRRGT